MKEVEFSFKLTAKGRLSNVFFYPEQETMSIRLETADHKVWENKSFKLNVANPFEYELAVFGVSGTEWEAELRIKGQTKAFIEWEGETGDTRRNVSIRTKPEKDV
ncbi:MAG: hypothetical protein RIM99_10070 [Cyclobacteriaceae bacterium]